MIHKLHIKVAHVCFCFCPCGEVFSDAIRMYSGGQLTVSGPTATAGIFSTYPADYLSVWGGVMDQVKHCHLHATIYKTYMQLNILLTAFHSYDIRWSFFLYFILLPENTFHLTCTLLLFPCRLGDRHGCTAAVCPGSWRPEQRLPPRRSPARPGGSSGAGYWHLDGLEQRLRPQPSQGFRASLVYVHCRLGS